MLTSRSQRSLSNRRFTRERWSLRLALGSALCSAALCSSPWFYGSIARAQGAGDAATTSPGDETAPTDPEAEAADAAFPEQPNALPGSPRSKGFGLSPEAPEGGPAIGGRAPSFGAPKPEVENTFSIGGRVEGTQAIGIGEKPANASPNSIDTPIHVPARLQGRQPFWPTLKGSLFLQYGNPTLRATVSYTAQSSGKERKGFYEPTSGGSNVGQAYVTITPQPMGPLQLRFRVGAFTEAFAGPGQWGWGIYGPMIATRGYGESAFADYDATDSLRLSFEHGIMGVPSVPEGFVRQGSYTGWTETGVSTLVQHAHAGFTYKNKFTVKAHWAGAQGTDEREYLYPGSEGQTQYDTSPSGPQNGRLDAFALETRWIEYPFGELGVSGALWNFDKAHSVHDGIWWGLDWTKGAQDFISAYLGSQGQGTGKVAAISAQYDMSLGQILWYPRPFGGNHPDVRVAVAGVRHWTLETDDPRYEGASGFMLGTDTSYQMLSWFGATLRAYGEEKDSDTQVIQDGDSVVVSEAGAAVKRIVVYSVSPGIAFRSDWQSQDRIEIAYTRRFYNSDTDSNPARPLDRNVISISAYIGF